MHTDLSPSSSRPQGRSGHHATSSWSSRARVELPLSLMRPLALLLLPGVLSLHSAPTRYFASCIKGLEPVLAAELRHPRIGAAAGVRRQLGTDDFRPRPRYYRWHLG